MSVKFRFCYPAPDVAAVDSCREPALLYFLTFVYFLAYTGISVPPFSTYYTLKGLCNTSY